MPKKLERHMKREVAKKHPGWSKAKKDRYVYGTVEDVKRERKAKGENPVTGRKLRRKR